MNQCRMTDLATAVNNGNRIIVTVKKVLEMRNKIVCP